MYNDMINFNEITAAVIEKYSDKMLKKLSGVIKDQWEKFKIDTSLAFAKYLKNANAKYSHIKTLLYRTEPKYIYEFFECNHLLLKKTLVDAGNINNLLNISHFLIVQGTGGIGKSTLMKHFLLNEFSKKDLIPVFIELKDLNNTNDSLYDCIYKSMTKLGFSLKEEYLEYALKSGFLLLLMDGYDEISIKQKDHFFKQLDEFCDQYSDNYFILSSRPVSEDFISFQRFTVLNICPLTKKQALSLIRKIDYDPEIKKQFMEQLDLKLYESHRSFSSNPLLLNIMLLTFDNYAEIPEKLHIFYANAFEALYSKHDATKAGFRREMLSQLSYDDFKRVFSRFSFITYVKSQIEFTFDDMYEIFSGLSKKQISFDVSNYISDLLNCVCVIYHDGLAYKFSHRSFQEYFAAVYLKELSDTQLEKASVELIKRDHERSFYDSVFNMLYDMVPEKFENNILIPLLKEVEKNATGNKYIYYFQYFVKEISITSVYGDKESLYLTLNRDNLYSNFIFTYLTYYRPYYSNPEIFCEEKIDEMETLLSEFFKVQEEEMEEAEETEEIDTDENDFRVNEEYNCSIDHVLASEEIFCLLGQTWIGGSIRLAMDLLHILEDKKAAADKDLSALLNI